MAESKSKSTSKEVSADQQDAGADEVQAAFDEATAQGFFGEPGPISNDRWSLESGPDSPNNEEVRLELAQADVDKGTRH